jgi:hypothetical protein
MAGTVELVVVVMVVGGDTGSNGIGLRGGSDNGSDNDLSGISGSRSYGELW